MHHSVAITAPARLHLGFFDLNGVELNRRFGSIGLTIDRYHTQLFAKFTDAPSSHEGELATMINAIEQRFYQQNPSIVPQPIDYQFPAMIPRHAGLGSGTQLALTIGTALSHLYQLPINTTTIASQLQRGQRSGIGIASFDGGGLIIDGGLGKDSVIPPIIARYPYPKDWCIILLLCQQKMGVHGQHEVNAFQQLPTFPTASAQSICHHTLMQVLPALLEHNHQQFSDGIAAIQAHIGDYFSSAQGDRYSHPVIAQLLRYADSLGFTGIAQSSWGPTGWIFVENKISAQQLCHQLQQRLQQLVDSPSHYQILVAGGQNHGATIEFPPHI